MITNIILSTALALCCAGANPAPDGDIKEGKKDFQVTVPQTADCTTDFIIEIVKN